VCLIDLALKWIYTYSETFWCGFNNLVPSKKNLSEIPEQFFGKIKKEQQKEYYLFTLSVKTNKNIHYKGVIYKVMKSN